MAFFLTDLRFRLRSSMGHWHRRGIGCVGALMFAAALLPRVAAAQPLSEYQVKATFIYNFAKFAEWPAQAFPSAQAPLTICIVGEDPLGKTLDDLVKGQSVAGHPYAVKRVAQISRDESCQIAYLGGLEKGRASQILDALRSLPVLTVGESDAAGEAASMIAFVVEDSKVRFDINLDTVERAGIKLSSKLLKLAKTVHDRRKN